MAKDNGKWNVTVDENGLDVDVKVGDVPAKMVTMKNMGEKYVYASADQGKAAVISAITAGAGCIPIEPSGYHVFRLGHYSAIGLACESGESTTVDWSSETY